MKISTNKNIYDTMDHLFHAWQGRFTAGVSPNATLMAYYDWLLHLANSPGKQTELLETFFSQTMTFWLNAFNKVADPDSASAVEPPIPDKRFKTESWQVWPYNTIWQSYSLVEDWWQEATTDVEGVSTHHLDLVSFGSRQLFDFFAPSNFFFINPDVLKKSIEDKGANLFQGCRNFVEDRRRAIAGKGPIGVKNFKVGVHVAVTPGKVVFRNNLMELIQYSPTSKTVYAEPVLIVPAWIMKYYILDLSPNNSLVKYLVDKGHTVFMISWKNPDADDRNLGMDDYVSSGIMDAIDAVSKIIPDKKINALGYCLGGTLLCIAAAAMARDKDDRLKSVSMLTAQTDFSEAGELMVFIAESEVSYLEDTMWNQGYLDTKQMAGAFQLLRSNDLIWSKMIHDYLMGEREPMNDLMAWNSDATRMPYRMHSEYLRKLFLNNDLFGGRFEVRSQPIVISAIHVPVFLVATEKDHVAPWRSVYKFHLASDAPEITFLLTSGGHNAGIISEPGHPHRTWQMCTKKEEDAYVNPDTWQETTPVHNGSWWVPWRKWVAREEKRIAPPAMGAPENGLPVLCDAPGEFVLQR